jgi:hypothetical protein
MKFLFSKKYNQGQCGSHRNAFEECVIRCTVWETLSLPLSTANANGTDKMGKVKMKEFRNVNIFENYRGFRVNNLYTQ